jgi:pantoate--beta-alanine ligase
VRRHDTIAELRGSLDQARRAGQRIGFVPTMGYLHDGHGSLIRAAAAECDVVVVSIFVNPLQFAANEDLADYPRDLERDTALVSAAGATELFTPSVTEMYPEAVLTTVSVAQVSEGMEGAARPTHFAGVATVVAKLFGIVGACRAYFGEKDFQQLAVVRRLVADLSLPVEVVGCPIVREPDGLAMSSRNIYLDPTQRAIAPALHAALSAGAAAIAAGESSAAAIVASVESDLKAAGVDRIDYVVVADPDTLAPVNEIAGEVRLLATIRLGRTRLLDNVRAVAPNGNNR